MDNVMLQRQILWVESSGQLFATYPTPKDLPINHHILTDPANNPDSDTIRPIPLHHGQLAITHRIVTIPHLST
jgi:hypothetical protein